MKNTLKLMTIPKETPLEHLFSIGDCCGAASGANQIIPLLGTKQARKSLMGMYKSQSYQGGISILRFLKANFFYMEENRRCGQGHPYTEYTFIVNHN